MYKQKDFTGERKEQRFRDSRAALICGLGHPGCCLLLGRKLPPQSVFLEVSNEYTVPRVWRDLLELRDLVMDQEQEGKEANSLRLV